MAIDVEAARLLIKRAALTAGNGLPDTYEVSLAKVYSNEMAKRVTDMAMQLHGGNGIRKNTGLKDYIAIRTGGPLPAAHLQCKNNNNYRIYGKTINQRSS